MSDELIKSSRDNKLDALKGFLIICVIYGHYIVPQNVSPIFGHIAKIIYYFHIPLFIAISTLFVRDFKKEWIFKKIKLIIIPFVFWFLFYFGILCPINPINTLTHSIAPITQGILWGNWFYLRSILWFLPALFSSVLIWSFYKNKMNNLFIKTIFWIIYIVYFMNISVISRDYHNHIPYGLDIAFYLLPLFFCVNFVYREHLNNVVLKKIGIWGSLVLIVLSSHAITIFEHVKTFTPYHHRIDLAQLSVPFTISGLLSMLVLSCSVLLFFLKLPELKWLSYIGRYSLFIFVLHMVFITTFSTNHVSSNPNFNYLLGLVLNILTCIFLPIIISKVLMKNWFKYIGAVK